MVAMVVENRLEHEISLLTPVARRRAANDPFFIEGDVERMLQAKQAALSSSGRDAFSSSMSFDVSDLADVWHDFCCPVGSCNLRFSSASAFEDHYSAQHWNVCATCHKVFLTPHLLDIHISETHDSFFQAMAARGHSVFVCLVEECHKKFSSAEDRQRHLVDAHGFPRSFRFGREGRKRNRMSRRERRRMKNERNSSEGGEVGTTEAMEVDLAEITDAVSRLDLPKTGPASISFGRKGRSRAFVR